MARRHRGPVDPAETTPVSHRPREPYTARQRFVLTLTAIVLGFIALVTLISQLTR